MSIFVEVGDALVAFLQSGSYGTRCIIERSYADVNDDLPALKDARIDVVLWKPNTDMDASGLLDYSHVWDVLIRRRFTENEIDNGTGRPSLAEIDKMVQLVEDVWERLIPCQPNQDGNLPISGGRIAKWDPGSARLLEVYIRNHLKKLTQYTGWIRVGYNVTKDKP